MVRKKIDNRIRVLIENGAKLGHRTLFVVVGDKGRDQVDRCMRETVVILKLPFNLHRLLFFITCSQKPR